MKSANAAQSVTQYNENEQKMKNQTVLVSYQIQMFSCDVDKMQCFIDVMNDDSILIEYILQFIN